MVILIIGILIVMVSLITFKIEGVNEISFFILMCGISITFVGFILDCITSEYKVSEMKEYFDKKKAEEQAKAEEEAKRLEEQAKADRLANPTVEDLLKDIKALLENK